MLGYGHLVPEFPEVGRGLDTWRESDESRRLQLRVRTLASLRASGLLPLLGLRGAPAVSIALVDGAIDYDHPCLRKARITGRRTVGSASPHATFLALPYNEQAALDNLAGIEENTLPLP